VALLWAVHPLQTGAVTYIVQRAESLMGLFYLLTIYCAIRGWTAAAIAACALGMATKESMVTAPLVVVAWDWVFAPRQMRRRVPLYLGLAATWTIAAVLIAGGYRSQSVGFGLRGWTASSYLTTQTGVITHYLRLAIVPYPLVLDYGWPRATSIAEVAFPAAVVMTLLALTVWAFARRLPIGFAGVWFFLILAPTSSFIPIVTEVAAEHRMYLPLAAVVSAVVCLAGRVARFQTMAIAFVILFGAMTFARNRDYQSSDGIWLDTIEKRPQNARARVNYASALLEQHRDREAEDHLHVAIGIDPDYPEALANLGAALCAQDRLDEGIVHLQRAIAIQPDYAAAYQNLGEAYGSQGRLGPAADAFARALKGKPDDVMLLNRRAWILATAHDDSVRNGREAVALAERAVALTNRRDAASLDTLAAAYAEVDRFDAAEATGGAALALAREGSDQAMVPELEQRLEAYRRREKIRE
jgi:Tfp pilus assembly protein PilF